MVRVAQQYDGDRFVQFFERMNRRLKPALGAAMIGPFDVNLALRVGPCPLCGEHMSGHAIEYTESDSILHCPVGVAVFAGSAARLSMLDMPMSRTRRARK
ncbi:MAG: hypothetical protein ABI275_00425 [Terrimesophilobacter sp.]